MIEVKTPKNILVYKTKILGPLTVRQTICFAIVGVIDFIIYQTIVKGSQLSLDVIFYLFVFCDVPVLIFGYYEPMGMPLEKYIKYYIESLLVAPKYRKNKNIIYKSGAANCKKKRGPKKSKKYIEYQ